MFWRKCKNIILYLLAHISAGLGDRASIFMYHSVGHDGGPFTVDQAMFERQMAYLRRKKYHVVSLNELIVKIKNGESVAGNVVVTFDDGYKNNYTAAFPVLKKYSIPFTIFLISDSVGKTLTTPVSAPALSIDEIREMSESGLAHFMPHSVTHRSFTKITLEEVKEEMMNSRTAVEEISGVSAPIFAFPRGLYTEPMLEYLRAGSRTVDWIGAVTVEEGLVSMTDDLFKLRRNAVDASVSFAHFKVKVSRVLDVYLKLKKLFT